jgi:hypothetical protein
MKTDAPKIVWDVPLSHCPGQTQEACIALCVRGFKDQLANLRENKVMSRSIQVPTNAEAFAAALRQKLNRKFGGIARISVSLAGNNEVRCRIWRPPQS